MGSGEIGSNGSVHYAIKHDDSAGGQPNHKDIDPISYPRIGQGTGGNPKNHPGYFAVRMRFDNATAAQNALNTAAATIGNVPGGNGVYLTCMVPVVSPMRSNPDADRYFEVKVDW